MEYVIIGGILIVLISIVWIIPTSNQLNRTIVKVEEADSGIDVALTKRYDVLTKMMEVVKAYAKHEKETMFEVINLRKGMTTDEKIQENNKMNGNFDKLQVIAEAYPELKSSDNYKTLQKAIVEVEEHLQAARRMYNSNVSIFNQMLVTFPTNIISNFKGLSKKEFFEIEEHKKQDVKIKL